MLKLSEPIISQLKIDKIQSGIFFMKNTIRVGYSLVLDGQFLYFVKSGFVIKIRTSRLGLSVC